MVFTFDDGYLDNYKTALPLFARMDAPFTVFVTTHMITRELNYWWGGIVELVRTNERIEVEAMGLRLSTRTWAEKGRALRHLAGWVSADVATRSAKLAPTFASYGVALPALVDRDGLSLSDLRALAAHPLVTIGGHTTSHRPLASLPAAEAQREVVENKRFLENAIQRDVVDFAYPHGDAAACGAREAEILRSAGFRRGFSTRIGNLFPEHAEAPFMLPRGSMGPSRRRVYHFEGQRSGVHRWLASGMGPPIDPQTLEVALGEANEPQKALRG